MREKRGGRDNAKLCHQDKIKHIVTAQKHLNVTRLPFSRPPHFQHLPTRQSVCLLPHTDNGPAGGRRTGTATVFVEVQDVNDNRPIFLQNSYETSVLESVPQGTSILQVESNTRRTFVKKAATSAITLKTFSLFLNETVAKKQKKK